MQFPWEPHPRKDHVQNLTVPAFYMDQTPITCEQYAVYLKASRYNPVSPSLSPLRSSHNWLKNWNWSHSTSSITATEAVPATPTVPVQLKAVPVTYISYNEADEYCRYNNKRLPSTWEWQLAAQGTTGNAFPWGNTDNRACRPELESGRVN